MKIRTLVLVVLLCLAADCLCIGQEMPDTGLAYRITPARETGTVLAAKPARPSLQNATGLIKTDANQLMVLQTASDKDDPTAAKKNSISDVAELPEKFFGKIAQKISRFNKSLTQSATKHLDRLIKNEKRLQQKLAKTDSTAAAALFVQPIDSLQKLRQQIIAGKAFSAAADLPKEYNAYLDSLGGSLAFLKSTGYLQQGKAAAQKLQLGNDELAVLKNKLQTTDAINQYIKERRETLTGYFSADKIKLLGGKELQQISATCYYYKQQYAEWKEAFSNPGKLEGKAMGVLRNLPLFKNFMQQYGDLAGLLDAPEGYGQSTAGLQTRDDIIQQVAQRFGSNGAAAQQMINGQLDAAKDQLKKLKEKFPRLDGTADMPDFKPKDLKTKTFLQRIEYGSTMGFSPHNTILPTAADMGLQAGYKLSSNGMAGIGASYKAGLGKNIQHIRLSNQGFGFRSFLDWNLSKARLHLNGGFEYNYLTGLTENNAQLPGSMITTNPWQPAALLGISKKFKIGKQTNKQVMLLYDFLHARHYPATEAIKFRVGYSF